MDIPNYQKTGFENLSMKETRQFVELLARCERIAAAARKSQTLCAVPWISRTSPHCEQPYRNKFKCGISLQSYSAKENSLHPLLTFPIVKAWNPERIFPAEDGDCGVPEPHASAQWGFIGNPDSEYGLFTLEEAVNIFPAILEQAIPAIGWLALNPNQPEW